MTAPKKRSVSWRVSHEEIANTPCFNPFSPFSGPRYTPEQVRANRAREKARIESLKRTWTHPCSVVQESTGLAVLAIHGPNEYGSCDGDHGYEEGSRWPCETVKAVADVYGFDLEPEQ